MKYIRTKDGRIEKTPFNDIGADTIEDLCDGFVAPMYFVIWWEKKVKTFQEILDYCEKTHIDKRYIKGFIETDKGLIYVAKMNEEGKLCLL